MTGGARLFVYGTLLRGEANHGWLRGSRCLGAASTEPGFELANLGPYPAMVAAGRGRVRGELYEVSAATLAALDELEEHPHLFERHVILLADGEPAFAYLMPAPRAAGAPRIARGDWRRRGVAQSPRRM